MSEPKSVIIAVFASAISCSILFYILGFSEGYSAGLNHRELKQEAGDEPGK